ncbi:sugar phosphate permease [Bradyrhizobium sp. i1.7.7]
MLTTAMPQPTASEAAVRYLITNYSPKGNKVGWLMMASILVEAWDLYSIAFVLIFIKEQYNPDPLMLGLAAAGTQGGALIGALLGGWLSDKIGRRVMFLVTMVLFIVLALAQGLRAERDLAHRDPLPARHSARLGYFDRLHLHHGIHGQG